MHIQPDPAYASGATRFVLVADNDANNLVFMSMILQRFEYPACSANNAQRALEMATVSAPSLIIAEMNLRGMSGLELMGRIRQEPVTRTVPVIIMTRELTPELEQQCLQEGAAGCLNKPVQADDLYRMVHPILEPGSRRRNVRIRTRLSVIVDGAPLDFDRGECAVMLSAKGMYIRTLKSYPLNAPVSIQINFYGQIVWVDARVIYRDTDRAGIPGLTGVGLQFQNIMPRGGEIIRRFINDEVTHGLAPGWA
ncbi:MAG: response regulator [Nitrospirae bacterium]|nr:response regulator [Nitrospirota bacterium]